MKYLFFFSALLFLAACSEIKSERAESRRVTDIRDVHDFSRIVMAGTGNLILSQGDKEEVILEADESLLPEITTQVTNGTLYIEQKPKSWLQSFLTQTSFNATVYLKNIEEVMMSGKGVVKAENIIKSKDLTVKVSGTGKVILDLESENFTASTMGTADFDLKGKATYQIVQISGNCVYKASDLISRQASIDIRGSGQVSVNVQDQLDIIITGKGSVRYKGKPQILQKIFGSGTIEELK